MAWWLFQNLVVTAALALGVALVCRWTRIGPVARHALWVIVLIRFVMPPVLVWPWAAPDPLGVGAVDPRHESGVSTELVASEVVIPADSAILETAGTANSVRRTVESREGSFAQLVAIGWPWLLALWMAGSLCVLVVEMTRLRRVARAVASATAGPREIVTRVARLSAALRLRPVEVLAVDGFASPAIWCVGRPRLLWPAAMSADITDACIDGLLVHELAHVQRRDHVVGWIELIAGVIWWWNPLFWYVRSALREQAELACDAWVISALPNGRRAYAESLLALSSAAVHGRSPALAAVIGIRANNRRVLERRLVMIMQGRASLRLSVAGLVALAVMALASLPAWATASQQSAAPPAPPTTVAQAAPVPLPPAPAQSVKPVTVAAPAAGQHIAPSAAVTTIAHPVVAPAHAVTVTPMASSAHAVTVTPGTQPAHAAAGQTWVTTQAPTPPQPQQGWVTSTQGGRTFAVRATSEVSLPADGQEVLKKFETDRDAIQQEADKKIEARRADLVKALQVLQDQYTKAGKLDEAVAIRDFIKAGAGANDVVRIRRR